MLAALAVAVWFALGGDADVDTEGQFDVDVPAVDADVEAPDVDVEGGDLPEVDVEGGDLPEVDVEGGDAEAEVPGAPTPAIPTSFPATSPASRYSAGRLALLVEEARGRRVPAGPVRRLVRRRDP